MCAVRVCVRVCGCVCVSVCVVCVCVVCVCIGGGDGGARGGSGYSNRAVTVSEKQCSKLLSYICVVINKEI